MNVGDTVRIYCIWGPLDGGEVPVQYPPPTEIFVQGAKYHLRRLTDGRWVYDLVTTVTQHSDSES